jgi:hypothetical protein
MVKASRVRSLGLLLLAFIGASCGSAEPERVLTVEQVVPRIDELNGQTVSVAGYLADCGGYDCSLYRNKDDADEWTRFMVAPRPSLPIPDHPVLQIGSATNFDFDAKAAPFTHRNVVITGTITNICRYHGRPGCTDRGPDLIPAAIRAGSPPAPR